MTLIDVAGPVGFSEAGRGGTIVERYEDLAASLGALGDRRAGDARPAGRGGLDARPRP